VLVSSSEVMAAEEVVLEHRKPRWRENKSIVQRVSRVPDLRAVCSQNDTGSLLPLTKLTPHITHTAAALPSLSKKQKKASTADNTEIEKQSTQFRLSRLTR